MKNALYFRGDVAVGVDDGSLLGVVSEDASIKFPVDDIDLNEQTDLGEGVSSALGQTNHAVVIIGWGPCQVTHVSVALRVFCYIRIRCR